MLQGRGGGQAVKDEVDLHFAREPQEGARGDFHAPGLVALEQKPFDLGHAGATAIMEPQAVPAFPSPDSGALDAKVRGDLLAAESARRGVQWPAKLAWKRGGGESSA